MRLKMLKIGLHRAQIKSGDLTQRFCRRKALNAKGVMNKELWS